MSLARVSELPTLEISTLTENEKERSCIEFSRLSSTYVEGFLTEKWFSRSVPYTSLRNDIVKETREIISAATSSDYGFIKLGAERDPENYKFPLELDNQGRAYTRTQKDTEVQNLKYEQWEFVLSTGIGTTRKVTKYMVVVDTLPLK